MNLIESLSNNDGDGYKNVTEKVNSRRLELYRAYYYILSRLIRQMWANFFGVEF